MPAVLELGPQRGPWESPWGECNTYRHKGAASCGSLANPRGWNGGGIESPITRHGEAPFSSGGNCAAPKSSLTNPHRRLPGSPHLLPSQETRQSLRDWEVATCLSDLPKEVIMALDRHQEALNRSLSVRASNALHRVFSHAASLSGSAGKSQSRADSTASPSSDSQGGASPVSCLISPEVQAPSVDLADAQGQGCIEAIPQAAWSDSSSMAPATGVLSCAARVVQGWGGRVCHGISSFLSSLELEHEDEGGDDDEGEQQEVKGWFASGKLSPAFMSACAHL